MSDNEGCALIAVILGSFCFFGIGWVTSCDSQATKTQLLWDHLEKPYCIDEPATVKDRTVHNKRCWKVIEVDP